jgi:DNA-binding IclR family transcriptional regulator
MPIPIKPRPRVILQTALTKNPQAKPRELAQQLGLSLATVQGLLPLVRRGYKSEGPLDRR